MARKFDAQGNPILLRDSRTSSVNFGFGDQYFSKTPKPKFLFYVRFLRANGTGSLNDSNGLDWSRGIGFVIKSIDRPRIQFETQTLNQYNKKRVIQTRVEYLPMTLRFHDTVDNKVFMMFEEYFRYYYGDPRASSSQAWNYDIIANEMNTSAQGYWGFNPPTVDPNFTYFFDHIEIYQLYGGRYNQFDLVHPKIIAFDPDDLDYSNGAAGGEITMQVAFEGILNIATGRKLTDAEGIIEEMNLELSDFYEPDDYSLATNQLKDIDLRNPTGYSTDYLVGNILSPRNIRPSLVNAPTQPTYASKYTNSLSNVLGGVPEYQTNQNLQQILQQQGISESLNRFSTGTISDTTKSTSNINTPNRLTSWIKNNG